MTASAHPPQVPESAAWTVHHDEVTCAYSVWNGEEVIADLFYARGFPEDQESQRIKAHLISAAPALVAALERFGRHDYSCPAIRFDGVIPVDDPNCDCGLRAALRLAGGGR